MQPSQPLHKYLDSCRNQPCVVDSKDHFLQRNMCSISSVKRIQHFTSQRSTFLNHCSALLSAAQFRVVKWTKNSGQHFLSCLGAFAVLHKNWNKKMPCEDWACAILMTLSTFLIAIKQGRAAPSGTEQYRAAPSSTERHRAVPSKTQQIVKRIQHFTDQECWALLGEMLYSFDRGLWRVTNIMIFCFRYLLEDQLRGPSSIQGYISVLKEGCRCLERNFFWLSYIST